MKIELQAVTKKYNDAGRSLCVLDKVSIVIESGSQAAIVGRSGIGKSTLLHILGGLDKPTDGRVLLGDTDLTGLSGDDRSDFRGQNIGFIFQFHHLLPEFTAAENVAMPLIIQGIAETEALSVASDLLQKVGLEQRETHRPGALSGGEQQRVAIARAVVTKPKLVLADEPTGSLDVESGDEVRQLLSSMCQASGSTLLVVTHNLEIAQSMNAVYEMFSGGSLVEKKG